MKQRALDVGIGMVARDLSLVEWKTYDKGKFKRDQLYYQLNTQPNVNQNASEFWQEVARKLLYEDNEVLIVVTSDDQFTIADNWNVNEFVLKENVYTDVQRGNFTFNRSFVESETIHLTYQNLKLKTLLRELDESYGKLFTRLVHVAMRTNQIRGTAKLTGRLAKDKDATKFLQTFIDRIFEAFGKRSEAIVPVQDGMEYEELSREANTRSQVDELNKTSDEYLNSVLEAIGIHPALVSGDMADVEKHQDKYLLNVMQPLIEQVVDEGNRKFYTVQEFLGGSRIKASVVKLRYMSPFEVGDQFEKLVGSSGFTPNEARELLGYDEVDDPRMDQYYLTKNIVPLNNIEGGDEDR